jgi:hypothetical protein
VHFAKALPPIVSKYSGKVTDCKLVQPLKVPLLIEEKFLGKDTETRSEHSVNAEAPILFTLSGRTTSVNPHFWKAKSPIEMMLCGNMTDLRFVHSLNA